jgi:hypothetical protein
MANRKKCSKVRLTGNLAQQYSVHEKDLDEDRALILQYGGGTETISEMNAFVFTAIGRDHLQQMLAAFFAFALGGCSLQLHMRID